MTRGRASPGGTGAGQERRGPEDRLGGLGYHRERFGDVLQGFAFGVDGLEHRDQDAEDHGSGPDEVADVELVRVVAGADQVPIQVGAEP
ncbi:MAG TPA: hypothetical protein VI365_27305 [Trebonia sp.]